MKLATFTLSLFVVLIPFLSTSAGDSAEEPKQLAPKFVVYAAEEDAEFRLSLFRILRGDDKVAKFAMASTIKEAVASKADVLVLVLPKRGLPSIEENTLKALKKRKIIGIGSGAAQLFGKLGLEINYGACATSPEGPGLLTISKSQLLGKPTNPKPIPVLDEVDDASPNADDVEIIALFIPPKGENASTVDVVARWTSHPNYAPIVRQGNCVLIGIPFPATQWTTPYSDMIREMCQALHARKLESFSRASREFTKPGIYKFKLAQRGSTDEPFTKMFFFRFPEACHFNAKLEHEGSDSVMLLFMGEDARRTHWTRKDAKKEETLQIGAAISQADIEKLRNRNWRLEVANFGANVSAECKLTITIEKQKKQN